MIPFDLNATIQVSLSIFADGKFAIEGTDEVVNWLLSDILDTEFFDNKTELDRVRYVFPESGSVGDLVITTGGQFLIQIFIYEHA